MPGIDYSRFDNLGDSDSEEEAAAQRAELEKEKEAAASLVNELPPELSPELSLVLAASQGQANVVESLLASRTSVDARDPHGYTALLRAVEGGTGNRAVIELLLKHGAAVDAEGGGGDTPLCRAAAAGSAELVEALLSGSRLPAQSCGPALLAASKAGNQATTQALILARAPVSSYCQEGATPLHYWADRGDAGLQVLKELLDARADVNARDREEDASPISRAAKCGSASAVRLLCDSGGLPPSEVEERGGVLLARAASCSGSDAQAAAVTQLLLGRGCRPDGAISATSLRAAKSMSPLVAAASVGRLMTAEILLRAGAGPDATDAAGRRPLPCAAAAGSVELCRALLGARADANARGRSGATEGGDSGVAPLSIAAAGGSAPLCQLLLEARADVEQLDERGSTPLMAAAREGFQELCSVLLAARASPEAQPEESGKTALVLAAGAGHAAVCGLLMDARADASQQASTGAAPMHAAAANGHESVCRALLQGSADPMAAGPGGKTPLELAAAAGHGGLAAVLSSSPTPQ